MYGASFQDNENILKLGNNPVCPTLLDIFKKWIVGVNFMAC